MQRDDESSTQAFRSPISKIWLQHTSQEIQPAYANRVITPPSSCYPSAVRFPDFSPPWLPADRDVVVQGLIASFSTLPADLRLADGVRHAHGLTAGTFIQMQHSRRIISSLSGAMLAMDSLRHEPISGLQPVMEGGPIRSTLLSVADGSALCWVSIRQHPCRGTRFKPPLQEYVRLWA